MVAAVAQEVVSFRAVAAARAHEAVVPVAVHSAFAKRASEVLLENGCSEPSLHHGFEENGLHVAVCPFRRNSVQPLAGTLYAGERKVREVAWVVARSLLELLFKYIIKQFGVSDKTAESFEVVLGFTVISSVCFLFPLAMKRDMSAFRYVSLASIGALLYTGVVLLIELPEFYSFFRPL